MLYCYRVLISFRKQGGTVTLFEKYRTFFIIGTAEGLGLILTKPKDIGLFFLTWTLLTLVMLVYSVLEWRFGKPKVNGDSATGDAPSQTIPKRNYNDLNTRKNRNYSLILFANSIAYLGSLIFF